jgi:Nif-specific regulatory protein
MNPRLVAISGPLRGTVHPLEAAELPIGRDPSNRLCISDLSISRKHCLLSPAVEGGEFEIEDLDSHNGTFVNGVPVSRKSLQHGDKVRIGSSEFLFLIGADESDGSSRSRLSNQPSGSGVKTILLDPHSGLPQDAVNVGRMARDLSGLFKIANIINSIRDLDLLQQKLLELISEVIPADHGAIVLLPSLDEEPSSISTWDRNPAEAGELQIRGELVRQSVWERAAVLTEVAASEDGENVLCVPLVGMEKTLGSIYVKSSRMHGTFGDDHAYFLSSVSRIAAVALENVITLDSLRSENRRLKAETTPDSTLIGESKAMRQVLDFIGRVANSDSTVLIRGESGTGKELVARAIHTSSSRADKPFVAINCAAIPEALLESELFGHEKGAFTGAVAAKKGKVEAAEDGTLFLDEIGEMAPLLQAKLLRVLQQREFERLGGNKVLPFRARVVAATNKNLEHAIKHGEFRQDLYFRLNVVSVAIPPLREHPEDIPLLALYFAAKYVRKAKRAFKGISAEARSLLTGYSWPGNVRELENAIEHAIVLGLTEEILPEDLPGGLLEEQAAGLSDARYHSTLNQTKKQLILGALEEAKGSYVEAARALGIHPKYLHRLVRNLDLKAEIRSAK